MDKVIVKAFPDNKEVEAYRYAPTVLLVNRGVVYDTDTSILTDDAGFRYGRIIRGDTSPWSIMFEYHMI